MQMYIKPFFGALIVFLLLDLIWIGYLGNSLYRADYASLLRKTGDFITPNWYAAVVVYILCIFGILLFVLPLTSGSILNSMLYGMIYGLIIYGFYNFTNYAVFDNWPLRITIIDTLWGAILCSTTSLVATYFYYS